MDVFRPPCCLCGCAGWWGACDNSKKVPLHILHDLWSTFCQPTFGHIYAILNIRPTRLYTGYRCSFVL